ncbi:MAG TPA: UDP-N-acetylglucosamine 2-epimerase (non-hydrolyzing) [Terracidiphilus sp.]|nr:UDP-N-acetylglucosamine 2-epimerase (non-hydrolyzing) [Terracidiphilus sp.]
MKVATIVGTRPEIIRLSRVIAALDRYTQHCLVHTGQNYAYELNQVFFEDLEMRPPDHFLSAAGATPAETIAMVISKSSDVLAKERPDAVLILGDTNSCLAAIAAKRLRIPVFHMEAGNRCFDERVPEEINRRIVDHISDINLPYSSISREYLLREGIAPDRIIKTGSPMYEVLSYYRDKIDRSDILNRLGLEKNEFFIASSHREENIDSAENFQKLVQVLETIASTYRLPVVLSVHPRTQKRLDAEGITFSGSVRPVKAMRFSEYVHLMMNARATLSDSGTITEEASILNFRALNIREAHERPEGMEEGAVMMTGLDPKRVVEALRILDSQATGSNRTVRIVPDYAAPNVSEKVARIVMSYVDYVRRVVWREYASG